MIEDIGDWKRTHYSKQVTPEMDEQQVIVMGWVRAIRKIGQIIFIQLADREGFIQITARPEKIKEVITKERVAQPVLDKIGQLGREYVIAVRGTVEANKEAPGGREIIPMNIRILNTSDAPLPLEIVTKKTPAELPTRLDARILDLRKPEVAAIFKISEVLKRSFFDYFEDLGFIDVNTPLIVGAAAEGGASLFRIFYFDKEAYLNQSPQLYKQMLLASGFDKVSIVGHVFRAEPHETVRHINEIIQMDVEEAFIENEEDVLKYFDGYFNYFIEELKKRCKSQFEILDKEIPAVKTPIDRITYDEALELLKENDIKMRWGEDFTPEAEKKICEFHNPVIITRWPSVIKPFYCMKDSDNPKYCRGFDLLFNGTEISSGAQREHRYDELVKNMKEKRLNPKDFKFYLEAFRFGMPPHCGWSIGLERLTMTLLNLKNIREAVLFPRTKERLFP